MDTYRKASTATPNRKGPKPRSVDAPAISKGISKTASVSVASDTRPLHSWPTSVSQVRATVLSHLRSPLSIEALRGDFGLRSRIVTLRHQSDDSDGAVSAAAGRVGGRTDARWEQLVGRFGRCHLRTL